MLQDRHSQEKAKPGKGVRNVCMCVCMCVYVLEGQRHLDRVIIEGTPRMLHLQEGSKP